MSQDVAAHVLIVDDDASQLRLLQHWLTRAGYQVTLAESATDALSALAQTLPDAILLDRNLPDADGIDTLASIKRHHPRVPVLMLTVEQDVATVVSAMQQGAWDYLAKPVQRPKLLTTLRNAVDKYRSDLRLATLEREVGGEGYPGILGRSAAMRELFRQMDRVAPSDITVLVRGESGTGKELVAQALHESSSRKSGPFVPLNCAAIPENLQESELFGHERGAFTGASGRRKGRFEQANGGTLFLDEVAELSPALQAKLLRALQERSFYRVGGDNQVDVDVRILAATHRDLGQMVRDGSFREDLYYRLAVFELQIPALREREGDILLLAESFLNQLADKHGGDAPELSAEARALLSRHSWPGNVRELHNAMERASVLARNGRVHPSDLPPQLIPGTSATASPPPAHASTAAPVAHASSDARGSAATPAGDAAVDSGDASLADLERQAIVEALERHGGNVSAVVRALRIPRSTLYRRLQAYGLR